VRRRRDDHRVDERLLDDLDPRGIGKVGRRMHDELIAGREDHPVGDGRSRHDEFKVELAQQPLGRYLHVQHAEEPTAEPEPERLRRLRLEQEPRVVQSELVQSVPEVLVLALLGIQTRPHHRLGLPETG
jgi:hypothetical protein